MKNTSDVFTCNEVNSDSRCRMFYALVMVRNDVVDTDTVVAMNNI